MRKQIIPKRLTAGLLSLVMLLTLLPAMSTPAAAASTPTFTVSGRINGIEDNGKKIEAKTNPMGDETDVVTIPTMQTGKQQTITIAFSKAAEWSILLGGVPEGMTVTTSKDGKVWTLKGAPPSYVQGRFLLSAKPTDGSTGRNIWVYYNCFDEEECPKIITETLPNGAVGEVYHADLAYSGATNGVVEWEVVKKDKEGLPPGVKLYTSTGTRWLEGTPTEAGTYTFTLTVTTIAGTSDKKTFTVEIDKARKDAELTLRTKLHAEIGREYTAEQPLFDMNTLITTENDAYPALHQKDGWSAPANLPAGLTLNADGTITGTVSDTATPGTYYFNATVTNGVRSYQGSAEIYVYRKPTAELKTDESGNETVNAGKYFIWQPLTGNDTPADWEIVAEGSNVTAEELESDYGLRFSADGGIWGTATQDGDLTLAVRRKAKDNYGNYIEGAVSDTVTLQLTIQQDRRFVVSETGEYTFPGVQVDAGGKTTEEDSAKRAKTFTVTGMGYSDVDVDVTLSGENARDFTLTVLSDETTLSKGDTLQFTVQPNADLAAGTYEATVTVRDTNGGTDAAEEKHFDVSFTVSESRVTPKVTNADDLPYAMKGQKYTYQFNAGGTPPYEWSLWDGEGNTAKPEGLSIDKETGELTWEMPEGWTETSVDFYVSAVPVAEGDTPNFVHYSRTSFNVYSPVEIQLQTSTKDSSDYIDYHGTEVDGDSDRIVLPEGYVDRNYDRDYQNNPIGQHRLFVSTAQNADWIMIEGALPEGMEFITSDGTSQPGKGGSGYLQGNPTKAGTYDFTIVAQNYSGDTLVSEDRQPVRLIIHEKFTVSVGNFGNLGWEVGKPISLDLSRVVSGGKKPYTFSTTSVLPDGLTLSEDGVLSGIPGESKQGFSFWLEVVDENGATASAGSSWQALMGCSWINLPPLELTVPDEGATFINKLSVGLSEEYKDKLKTGEYTLSYQWQIPGKINYNNAGGWSEMTAYTDTITLSEGTINDKLNGWKMALAVGDKVTVKVKLQMTGYSIMQTKEITFTKVAVPTAPTASPGTANGTYTFTGAAEYVQLFASTTDGDVGIAYTTDGTTTPAVTLAAAAGGGLTIAGETAATKVYDGVPVTVKDGTTLKAVCFRLRSFGKYGTQIDYSPVAEFRYEQTAGVTVSGTAVSWNDTDDAAYYLYPTAMEDKDIRAQWKTGGEVSGFTYTGTKVGTITDVTMGGNAMKSQSFRFTGVTPGNYKLVIFKPGKYVPKIVSVTITGEQALGEQKLWLYGDVNCDNAVDTNDVLQINRHINSKGSLFNNFK